MPLLKWSVAGCTAISLQVQPVSAKFWSFILVIATIPPNHDILDRVTVSWVYVVMGRRRSTL